jgi:hypothetical protein
MWAMAFQYPVCRSIVRLVAVWLVMQSTLAAQAQSSAKTTFDTFRAKVASIGSGEPLHAKIVEVFKIDPPPRVFAGKIALKSNGRDRLIWLGFSRTTPDVFFIDGNPAENTFMTVFQADGSLQLRAAAAGNGYDELKPIATERVAEQFQYVLRVSESFLAGTLKKLSQPR